MNLDYTYARANVDLWPAGITQRGLPAPFVDLSPLGDKALYYDEFHRLLNLAFNERRYERAVQSDPIADTSSEPSNAWLNRVLESYEGHVDSIEHERAFVTLRAPTGEVLLGSYSATDLARYGILDGDRFECSTVRIASDEVRIKFRRLSSLAETPEAMQEVSKRFEFDWGDDNFSDDY